LGVTLMSGPWRRRPRLGRSAMGWSPPAALGGPSLTVGSGPSRRGCRWSGGGGASSEAAVQAACGARLLPGEPRRRRGRARSARRRGRRGTR